jgi:hypothetical protein
LGACETGGATRRVIYYCSRWPTTPSVVAASDNEMGWWKMK